MGSLLVLVFSVIKIRWPSRITSAPLFFYQGKQTHLLKSRYFNYNLKSRF